MSEKRRCPCGCNKPWEAVVRDVMKWYGFDREEAESYLARLNERLNRHTA